jgi:hypothetical protein
LLMMREVVVEKIGWLRSVNESVMRKIWIMMMKMLFCIYRYAQFLMMI